MDVVSLSIIVGALFAGSAAGVHFYDRFAKKGLYQRTLRRSGELSQEIGAQLRAGLDDAAKALEQGIRALPTELETAVESALNRVADKQRTEMAEAAKLAESELAGHIKSAEMSMVRSVGVDRQVKARIDRAISEAILGPAMPILRQFAPGLAEALEENPQLVDVVIQNPLFKKYVEPRIAAFLGSQQAQQAQESAYSWGV